MSLAPTNSCDSYITVFLATILPIHPAQAV